MRHCIRFCLLSVCLVTFFMFTTASADIVGYDYTTMTNQPNGWHHTYGVGHRFIPSAPIEVTSLGFSAWEQTNSGVLPAGSPTVTLQLYD